MVQPSDAPPVRYRGRIWIRAGPSCRLASARDERVLNDKRRHRNLPFDLQPVLPAKLTDLNRLLFEEEDVLEDLWTSPTTPRSICQALEPLTGVGDWQLPQSTPSPNGCISLLFNLTNADGAIGSHALAVQEAYADFRDLARKIEAKMNSWAEPTSPPPSNAALASVTP